MNKQDMMSFVTQLPDQEFTLEDLQYRLSFYAHLQKGLKDADEGRIHSMEDVAQELEQWLSE